MVHVSSVAAIGPPDCVLLDLNLPDANGIAALERIKGADPNLPIVVLTGLNDEHFGMSAVASGAQDYLVKGRVEPEMLRRAVLYAIERKRAELTSVELHASQLRALRTPASSAAFAVTTVIGRSRRRDHCQVCPQSEHALLGGDFYDFVQTQDRTVHVMIGDIPGHGPDEAALGVALRIAWRALTFAGLRGPDRMRELERILRSERERKGTFATVLSLAIPPRGSMIHAVRAGHPGMLVHGNDTVEWLEPPGGSALGLASGQWEYCQVEWPAGHGPRAAHRRAVRGTHRAGRCAPRGSRVARGGPFACHPARSAFVDALIEAAGGAPHPTADWLTTSRSCGSSGRRSDEACARADAATAIARRG